MRRFSNIGIWSNTALLFADGSNKSKTSNRRLIGILVSVFGAILLGIL